MVGVKSITLSKSSLILRTRRTAWPWTMQSRPPWRVRTAKDLVQSRRIFDDWRNVPKTRPVRLHVSYAAYVKTLGLWHFRCGIRNAKPLQVHNSLKNPAHHSYPSSGFLSARHMQVHLSAT